MTSSRMTGPPPGEPHQNRTTVLDTTVLDTSALDTSVLDTSALDTSALRNYWRLLMICGVEFSLVNR